MKNRFLARLFNDEELRKHDYYYAALMDAVWVVEDKRRVVALCVKRPDAQHLARLLNAERSKR